MLMGIDRLHRTRERREKNRCLPRREVGVLKGDQVGYDKFSKDRLRGKRKAQRRQEARWARKSGPVQTRFVCPVCGGAHSRAEHSDREAS